MSEQNQNSPQNNNKNHPGLSVRQQGAKRLDFVLAGNSFEPFNETDIADQRDRAIANRLISVALRRHGHISFVIEQLMKRGVPKRSGLFEAILRIGLAQLLFLPDMGAHSAIHLAVEAAKRDQHASRFDRVLNGVLRQAQREAARWRALDNALLFPQWLVKNWTSQYGGEAVERFGKALIAGASLDICLKDENGPLRDELGGKKLIFDSIRIEKREMSVVQMPGFESGQWWVQDVAATLAARLFDLKKGASVLDMCAAPGGKTAQLIKAGYAVTALDNSPGRIKRLEQNLSRLDYEANIVEGDAKNFRPEQKFDGVLIDAPCSATGTFRRHPEVLIHRLPKDIKGRVGLQRQILTNGVDCLNKGGQLILCVCSLLHEEGEAQANWVLHNFPQLRALPVTPKELGGMLGAIDQNGWVRVHPGLNVGPDLSGMDGFFVARWILD